jgi:ceramide glucosyltransferase
MADSNVLLPPDYIQRLFSRWTPRTGLVSSPAIGSQPIGFWSELECAFLNTYQARWQLAADQLGLGFAQGKNMLWRRDFLDSVGGIAALGKEMAEDVAATKIVRNAGLKVRLVRDPFPQPLGVRSAHEVLQRQLRWARLRRMGLKAYFIPELFTGAFFPLSVAGLIAAGGGFSFHWVAALCLIWYGAELMLARSARWPSSTRSILTWILRDFLLPVLWVSAWTGNSFVWRGNQMALDKKPRPIQVPTH